MKSYDAGLLSDYGGGNIEWWQDYIRSELARSDEYYQAEISRLQGENERLQNLIGDRDAEIATAFEQGRIFGNGEVEDKIQTAEQRVARDCCEIAMKEAKQYDGTNAPKCIWFIAWSICVEIKAKYQLED